MYQNFYLQINVSKFGSKKANQNFLYQNFHQKLNVYN